MSPQFTFLGLMLLQSAVLSVVVIALCDIVRTTFRLDGVLAVCGTILLLDVLGYLTVALAYVDYRVFGAVKIIVLALLLIRFAFVVCRRRLSANFNLLGEPLLYIFLFFSAVTILGLSNGGLENLDVTPAIRFSHRLPNDNIIPKMLAEQLKQSHVLRPAYGDWLSSDRPPLQIGLYLALALQTGNFGYQIVTSWLQSTFLFGVWVLAVAAQLPVTARRLVLLTCCLLPTTIINTFYTWPKLISVGNLLMVFALLFCFRPTNERERWTVGILLGGLAAFAVLAHGTAAFALIGMAIVVLAAWRWPAWKTIASAIATLVVCYAPWMAYQRFIDPPGNRLIKWHLAGVVPVGPRGFWQSLRDSYSALSLHDYILGRFENFKALIGSWPLHLRDLVDVVFNPRLDVLRVIRHDDFFYLIPSLHFFSLAVIVAIVVCPYMGGAWREQRLIAAELFAAGFCTAVTYAVLLFIPGSAVNHQGTYAAQVMLTVATFMVLSLRAPAIAVGFIAVQTVSVAIVYAFTLPRDPAFLPTQILCGVATIGLFAYAFAPMLAGRGPFSKRARPQDRAKTLFRG
jgi:hypothetical protein